MLQDIYKGNTVLSELKFFIDGVPLDITGAKVYFTVKVNRVDPYENAVIKKVIETHTTPLVGETNLLLTPTDTNLLPRRYVWDITLEFDSENIITVEDGTLNIKSNISDV